MNKILLLCLTLLLSIEGLPAEPAYQNAKGSKTAEGTPGPAVLEGCLQRTHSEYTLTDKEGLLHRLSDGSKLKQYVGHEVELSGVPSIRTIDTTTAGGASSAVEQHYVKVTNVKDLAATCPYWAR